MSRQGNEYRHARELSIIYRVAEVQFNFWHFGMGSVAVAVICYHYASKRILLTAKLRYVQNAEDVL